MDELLAQRLSLLKESQTISAAAHEAVCRTIARFADPWAIHLNEENGARLVTHLAMALARIEKGEPVGEMDKEAYAEFAGCEVFPKAVAITEDLIAYTQMDLPKSEREFLETNICLILDA